MEETAILSTERTFTLKIALNKVPVAAFIGSLFLFPPTVHCTIKLRPFAEQSAAAAAAVLSALSPVISSKRVLSFLGLLVFFSLAATDDDDELTVSHHVTLDT